MATVVSSTGTVTLLTRLTKKIYTHAAEAGMGMHPKQYAVMSVIRDRGQVTQGGLGESMVMDANTVVHLLNSIEEEGWAERRRDPEDRRRHIVALTPAGEKALAEGDRAFDAVEGEVLAELSEKERSQLSQLLRRALGD